MRESVTKSNAGSIFIDVDDSAPEGVTDGLFWAPIAGETEDWSSFQGLIDAIGKTGQKGGEGSGHHGHEGRPGEIGGSKPGDPKPEEPDLMFEKWPGDFDDLQKLDDWAEKRYPWMKFGFKGMDLGFANETLRQWFLLEKAYPDAAQTVRYFGTYYDSDSPGLPGFLPSHAWACVRDVQRGANDPQNTLFKGIFFNERVYGDPVTFLEQLSDSAEPTFSGEQAWHPPDCDSPGSIVTHEFAHVLDHYLTQSGMAISPVVMHGGVGSIPDMYYFWKSRAYAEAKTVSGYAKHSMGEFFAESLTSMWHTKPENRPQVVKDMAPVMSFLSSTPKYKMDEWVWAQMLPIAERGPAKKKLREQFGDTLVSLGLAREGWFE